uniref:Uncharacterized protein n=1 Tax=Noctiluca scintillans TaxID=2966 RepID=A0A7S1EY60_NOCSC
MAQVTAPTDFRFCRLRGSSMLVNSCASDSGRQDAFGQWGSAATELDDMDQAMRRLRGDLARAQSRRAHLEVKKDTLKASIAADVMAQVEIKAEVNKQVKRHLQQVEEVEEVEQQQEEEELVPKGRESPLMFTLDDECQEDVDDLDWERGFRVFESASKTRDRSLSLKVHLMSSSLWRSPTTDVVVCKINDLTNELLSLQQTVASGLKRSRDSVSLRKTAASKWKRSLRRFSV